MNWRQTLAAAVVLGMVAAVVVMFLYRAESARLHGEVSNYLERWDRFRQWEAEHGG